VHKRVTDGRRAVLNLEAKRTPLYRRPQAGSATVAYLAPRAMADLDRCEKGWCRIKAPGAAGWMREGAIWGTAEAPQCR
jgi:SH3-like domain-containing protein